MLVYISLALLAVGCVLLAWVARELGKQLRVLTADMSVAKTMLKCAYDNDIEFDSRITDERKNQREFGKRTDERLTNLEDSHVLMQKTNDDFYNRITGAIYDFQKRVAVVEETMAAAEDLIKEHAELEKEAVKSEQLFQEGLTNILNFGVVKNE